MSLSPLQQKSWQKQLKGGRVPCGSQFEGHPVCPHGGGAVGRLTNPVLSTVMKQKERKVAVPPASSFSFSPGPQLIG